MRIISACLAILILLFSFSTSLIVAQEATQSAQESTPSAQISGGQIDEALLKTVPIRYLPSHPLYFLITTKEAITRFFRPSAAQRAKFDFILSGKRLKETYLLIDANNFEKARKNLSRYSLRTEKMVEQIEKARSQNQDIAKQIGDISDGFQHHEVLLISFFETSEIESEVTKSIKAFGEAVVAIEKLNPGLKNRFKILNKSVDSVVPPPSPTVTPDFNEATPSVRPRSIIL